MRPDLSIIIAAYNVEAFLPKALSSIRDQIRDNLEVIIVDDGSTDSTKSIAMKMAESDSRFHLLSQKNEGPGYARNLGFKHSQGRYIHFMDADDWLAPDFSDAFIRQADKFDADMVIGTHYSVSKNDLEIIQIGLAHEVARQTKAVNWQSCPEVFHTPPPAWDKIYKSSFLKEHNIDFIKGRCEDLPFRWKTLIHAERIAVVSSPYYFYRQRLGAQTGGMRLASEVFYAIDEGYEAIRDHPNFSDIYPYFITRSIIEIVYPLFKAKLAFSKNPDKRRSHFDCMQKTFLGFSADLTDELRKHIVWPEYLELYDRILQGMTFETFDPWYAAQESEYDPGDGWVINYSLDPRLKDL